MKSVHLASFAIAAIAVASLATGLQLRAEYRGPRWQVYLFKPLALCALLPLAALAPAPHGARYQGAVALGLVCSLIGDVFLMLPRDRFVPGLASFLLAHVAYVVAFTAGVPAGSHPALLLPLAAVAGPLLWALWPGLRQLRVPVLIYTAVILLMVWRAWARNATFPSLGTTFATAGATLFMVSDALLALNRFRRPFRPAQALVMTSYIAAQALIALSVGTA